MFLLLAIKVASAQKNLPPICKNLFFNLLFVQKLPLSYKTLDLDGVGYFVIFSIEFTPDLIEFYLQFLDTLKGR